MKKSFNIFLDTSGSIPDETYFELSSELKKLNSEDRKEKAKELLKKRNFKRKIKKVFNESTT